MKKAFWITWALDALAALVVLYFFFIGILDGSVSSFNIALWIVILAVLAAVLGGGLVLHYTKHPWLALIVLAILAIPAALYGFFVVLLLLTQPRWN